MRIKEASVSEIALSFVDSLNFNKKVGWNRENTNNKTSIEANSRKNEKKYSIEFNRNGTLEDVEVEIDWDAITNHVRTKISGYQDHESTKYSIDKVPVQHMGTSRIIWSYLQEDLLLDRLTFNYGMGISTKEKKAFKTYGYLFTGEASYVRSWEIIQGNTDNFEF